MRLSGRLTLDLRQLGHGDDPGADHVAQDVTRPDRRQLVGVTHQQQVRAVVDRRDQLGGEPRVAHRHLVDHHEVVGQALVAP
jgi:hypothetical protein